MAKNPNLIPTTIVDKNGKKTTVHKKPMEKTMARVFLEPGSHITTQLNWVFANHMGRVIDLYRSGRIDLMTAVENILEPDADNNEPPLFVKAGDIMSEAFDGQVDFTNAIDRLEWEIHYNRNSFERDFNRVSFYWDSKAGDDLKASDVKKAFEEIDKLDYEISDVKILWAIYESRSTDATVIKSKNVVDEFLEGNDNAKMALDKVRALYA